MSSRTTSLALENPPVSRRELSQDFCSSVTDMFIVVAMQLGSHVGLYCQYRPGGRIPQLHRPKRLRTTLIKGRKQKWTKLETTDYWLRTLGHWDFMFKSRK